MRNESPLALISGTADNLLYNIFENLSVGLQLYDKGGFMVEVNHAELKSMGINNREVLLGRSLFDIPSLSDKQKQQIMNGETIHFMSEYDFDKLRSCFPTYLFGIKYFEVTISSVFNETGQHTNYLVVTQEVTERVLWQRKYENLYEDAISSKRELIESEQKMTELLHHNELVLNNTNSGLAYITNDYIVQWENISLCSKSLSYEAYKKGGSLL